MSVFEFFWSVFSRIRTEHRDLRSKSPYSVQIGKIRTRKKNFSQSDTVATSTSVVIPVINEVASIKPRDHLFSTYAKFSEILRVRIRR